MSAETKAALEAAIEAHIADEHDDPTLILSAYILQAMGSGISDSRNALTFCGLEGASAVTSLGLLAYAQVNIEGFAFSADG